MDSGGCMLDRDTAAEDWQRAADEIGLAIARGQTLRGEVVDAALGVLLSHRPTDPKALRRTVLRRYWRKFCPGATRCAAAQLIAAEWRMAKMDGVIEPGSRADFFRRLESAGFSRVGVSTITRDLDHELDR